MIGLGKKKKKPLDLSAPAAPAVAPSKKAKLQLPPSSSSSSAPISSAPLALPAAPEVAPTKVPDSKEATSKKDVVGNKSSGEANKASRKRDVDGGDGDDAHQSSSDNSDDDEEGAALSIDAIFESKKELKRLQKEQEESERKLAAKLAAEGKGKFKFDRSDLDKVEGTGKWVDDGLGGVYNKEGWTGRTDDGLKVYKAHLFNKKGFGTTKDCPFDCDCCFI